MRIFTLALKDLGQTVRDRRSLLFLVVMPVAFTIFMGFAYGRGVSGAEARVPVAVVDRDSGMLSRQLGALLEESTVIRVERPGEADAARLEEQVQTGKLAAALLIPAGFGDRALAGEPAALTLIVDDTTQAGQSARETIQTLATRVLSAAAIGRINAAAQEPFADEAARQAAYESAAAAAIGAWQSPAVTARLEKAGGLEAPAHRLSSNPYTQASPGMIVQFTVFGLTTTAMVLVLERKTRTLPRMLTTAISRAEIIAGHALAMFVVVFLQEVLLVVVGQFGFGVAYGREPLGTLLVMAALGAWIAAMGMFVGAVAKGEEQVVLFALIAMFLFSAFGGAWFPLEIAGPAFSTLGHLTPGAWAMDGFQNIVLRGLGLNSVLLPAGILMAWAAVFLGLAAWRLRVGAMD